MTKLQLYALFRRLHLESLAAWMIGIVVTAGAAAQPAVAPCATCIVPSLTPGQALALPARLAGMELLVRVANGDPQAITALQAIRERDGLAGIHLIGVPAAPIDRAALELASRVLIDISGDSDADLDSLAFRLKSALTALRAAAPRAISVGVVLTAPQERALLARDLGPYVDLIVRTAAAPQTAAVETWGTIAAPLPDVAALIRAAGARSATDARQLWLVPEDVVRTAQWLSDLAAAAPLLPRGLVPGAGVQLSCAGRGVETFLNPETLDTIGLTDRCDAPDVVAGAPAGVTPERVALSSGDVIIRVPAAQDRVAEGVQVTAARRLSVEEIIARHQAAAARQSSAIRELISSGTMTLTFEAPGFPAPVTISSQITMYTGRDRTEIEQRAVRVNGIEFRGGQIPRLPIIEPERVASPPLAITLTNVYRYELAGRDTIDGTPCYVVAFAPVKTERPLFRGRAWIAADTFAMVKVDAAQTGLRGPIVSSEQVDEFRNDGSGRWLLARSDVRQIYEGAAHRTPIHRVTVIAQQEVNPPEFTSRRAASYASSSIMLRDTPEGFRYLRRHNADTDSREASSAAAREPEIARGASRVRTLVGGVIVDPNITRPLPFAGLSYMDFNLLGTGAQLNAFFGGTYGQMAFSAPSLGGTRWQLAGRAFGIVSSYNDRAFIEGREQYAQNIRQRPAHASVWLLRPISPRLSVRAGYDLDYTHFSASEITAASFVVPAHQVNHGARFALEGQRGGWNASVWWNPAVRTGWRAWGASGEDARGAETDPYAYEPGHRDFQRYGATLTRSAVITPRLVARVEAAWMGGHDLDRFSRYAFGTFDNRLRGYPSALIRYDRGGVVRNAVAWSPGRLLRLDGFFDTAYVRDPAFASKARSYTGLGAAVEAPAPFGTLLAIEWGYGIQGIKADGGRGTQVIRISAFKIF